MIFPIVGQALVEVGVLVLGDFLLFLHPNGLGLVEFLKFS